MNGTTTAPSICSYNGTFNVAVDTGDKVPDRNSMVLTYDVYPSAPLLVIN